MTMAAGPVSLEHRARGTPTFDDADSNMDAEGEEDSAVNGENVALTKADPSDTESRDSDSDIEVDAEEGENEEDELSANILGSGTGRRTAAKIQKVAMVDEEEMEESSVDEGSEESEEGDSDEDLAEAADFDAVSEAAETAASAEVQNRNNCV